MERLFDKIGDHFNNPEMADRILVVKIRTDGWEQLEAAVRVRTSSSVKFDPDSSDGENFEERSKKDATTSDKHVKEDSKSSKYNNNTDSRSESCVSADSGIAVEESKCATSKRKMKKETEEDASPGSGVAATTLCTSEKGSPEDVAQEQRVVTVDPAMTESSELTESESRPTGLCTVQPEAKERTCTAAQEVSESCLQSTVIVEHELYVHSFWLALNSSYFRSMLFRSGMKETRCKKVEMNISQSLSAMFLKLIESLYKPEVVVGENVDNLLVLMRLAHLYDCDSTLKACQRLLSSAHLTVKICDRALNMPAHEMLPEMEEFIKRSEAFLVAEFSPLDDHWASENFLALSSNALKTVLDSSDLCVSSENTVFLALMRWAEVNEVFEDNLQPLLDLVHMKTMTINYLHDVVTSDHPIASTVPGFHELFEEAVFYHAFSTERRRDEGEPQARKISKEPIVFRWTVDFGEDLELERKKKIVKSPHFWVSGYEMFLELKLRVSGFQGLYLTICTQEFRHTGKGFVKLEYSLTSNCQKATQVIKEADVFDREGSGWGYEEFFPLTWLEFRNEFQAHLDTAPLVITAQVRLLE